MKNTILFSYLLCACSSTAKREVDESSLVRVAIVKLVNVSKAPAYEYLSDSLTEATRTSMQRKFRYADLAATETTKLFSELDSKGGALAAPDLRAHALSIDADLVIYGRYTTSTGKKGDTADIAFSVFRVDRGIEICNVSRKAVISSTIFKEIDGIAAQIVAEIAAYRTRQITQKGTGAASEVSGEKIELTRESIDIPPFIPPAF